MPLLQLMQGEAFDTFLAVAVSAYASDNVAAGRWRTEDAPELARAEISSLLPDRENTRGHFLFEVIPSNLEVTVGYLWFSTLRRGTKRFAHVYQIYVLENYRRRGYARAALLEAEILARDSGHDSLALNVFATNVAALALYASLGYSTMNLTLFKELP